MAQQLPGLVVPSGGSAGKAVQWKAVGDVFCVVFQREKFLKKRHI